MRVDAVGTTGRAAPKGCVKWPQRATVRIAKTLIVWTRPDQAPGPNQPAGQGADMANETSRTSAP
jgi:hypothetical protein